MCRTWNVSQKCCWKPEEASLDLSVVSVGKFTVKASIQSCNTHTWGWYEITVNRFSAAFWSSRRPNHRPLLGPEPQGETPACRMKGLLFGSRLVSVCMSNKCCFDKDASGQESLCCPHCEPLKPSAWLLFPPPLFHYLPLKSLVPLPFSSSHSLPSLQFTLTSVST